MFQLTEFGTKLEQKQITKRKSTDRLFRFNRQTTAKEQAT